MCTQLCITTFGNLQKLSSKKHQMITTNRLATILSLKKTLDRILKQAKRHAKKKKQKDVCQQHFDMQANLNNKKENKYSVRSLDSVFVTIQDCIKTTHN